MNVGDYFYRNGELCCILATFSDGWAHIATGTGTEEAPVDPAWQSLDMTTGKARP